MWYYRPTPIRDTAVEVVYTYIEEHKKSAAEKVLHYFATSLLITFQMWMLQSNQCLFNLRNVTSSTKSYIN